jgi:hypothetical protein
MQHLRAVIDPGGAVPCGPTVVMPGLVPGIRALLGCSFGERRGWPDISAFTRVFDALCPAMTNSESVPNALGMSYQDHTSSVAVTGTWSDGRSAPRYCRAMATSDTRSPSAGEAQMWSSRRPLSAVAQSGER